MSVIQHKRGRPTRVERIKIRKDLQPYFEKRIPAYRVAQITGYDVKTVNKYYKEFFLEIHGYEIKNFVKRYENEMIRVAITFENLIIESYDMFEDVKNEIQEFKDKKEPVPSRLIQSHSKIIRDIAHLAEKKASLLMSPNASDMIEEEVEKRFGKHV